MISYEYAYLLGTLIICFPVWFLIFKIRKDLRQEMILLGIAAAVVAPFAELLFIQDYWKPQFLGGGKIGIESMLFSFLAFGIATSFIKTVFNINFEHSKNTKRELIYLELIILTIFFTITFEIALLVSFFNMISIYASMLIFFVLSAVIVGLRKDLIKLTFMNSLMAGIFCIAAYQVFILFFPQAIRLWWNFNNISSTLILGIPIEEILWALSFGMFMGPFYEFIIGLQYGRLKKSTGK